MIIKILLALASQTVWAQQTCFESPVEAPGFFPTPLLDVGSLGQTLESVAATFARKHSRIKHIGRLYFCCLAVEMQMCTRTALEGMEFCVVNVQQV